MKIIDNTEPAEAPTATYGNLKPGDRWRYTSDDPDVWLRLERECESVRLSDGRSRKAHAGLPVVRVDADGRGIIPDFTVPSWSDARPGDVVIGTDGGRWMTTSWGHFRLQDGEIPASIPDVARIVPAADVTIVLGPAPDEVEILERVLSNMDAHGTYKNVLDALYAARERAKRSF